jgi:hypothetical protein
MLKQHKINNISEDGLVWPEHCVIIKGTNE